MAKHSDSPKETQSPYQHGVIVSPGFNVIEQQLACVPNFSPPAAAKPELPPSGNACSLEESNEYRSAGIFMKALVAEVMGWAQELPENYRPAIMAVLQGGIQIQVQSLAQVSFDGIRIEGSMNGRPCSLLAHQSTIQMLCYAQEINKEEPAKRPIGFIWPDNNVEI